MAFCKYLANNNKHHSMHTITPGLVNQTAHFGAGVRHQAAAEVERLGCARALVLSTPEQSATAAELAQSLGALAVGTFTGAAMHTPVEVTAQAQQYAESVKADCLVAVGGGSTTGLGKALALRTHKPQIVIPTTYAGSEATPILGQTEKGLKTTLKDARVLPQVVLYDPELVVSLPVALSATSGLNAMAHAVEALYAQDRSAATTELALDGLHNLTQSLPQVLAKPTDLTARETSLRGAWACGAVLGLVGMALHHKLCHTLGGSFDTAHAPTHAIILPHAVAHNQQAVPDLLAPLTTILPGANPAHCLWHFAQSLNSPMSLQSLGLQQQDLPKAADIAIANPYWNPRPLTRNGILTLLQDAWAGTEPRTH